MRKLFLFLAMLSVIGVLGVVSVVGTVSGLTENQNLTVSIEETVSVVISPAIVNFSSVAQGSINNPASENITITGGSSANVDMNVEVTSVTGAPFATGLKFDGAAAQGKKYTLTCDSVSGVCAYNTVVIVPTLDVPAAFPKSSPSGLITYSITGPTPSP